MSIIIPSSWKLSSESGEPLLYRSCKTIKNNLCRNHFLTYPCQVPLVMCPIWRPAKNITIAAFSNLNRLNNKQWRSQKFGLGVHLDIFGQKDPFIFSLCEMKAKTKFCLVHNSLGWGCKCPIASPLATLLQYNMSFWNENLVNFRQL